MLKKIAKTIGFQTKREVIYFSFFCILAVLLSNINHILAWLNTPPGYYYLGSSTQHNLADVNAYLTRINQGFHGFWYYTEWYTPESVNTSILYLPYLLLGHISRLLSLDNRIAFHLGRLVSTLVLFLGLFALASLIQKKTTPKILAFTLLIFPIGFNWLLINYPFANGSQITDANTFPILTYAPHFILGAGLLCWIFWGFHQLQQKQHKLKYLVFTICAISLQGLVYPFIIVPIYLSFIFYYFFYWLKNQTANLGKSIKELMLLSIPGIITISYYSILTLADTYYNNWWWEQQGYGFMNPFNLIVGFGFVGFFSFFIAYRTLISKKKTDTLLLIAISWFLSSFFCYYLPLPFAGRFVFGLQIPIAIIVCMFLAKTGNHVQKNFYSLAIIFIIFNTGFIIWDTLNMEAIIADTLAYEDFLYLTTEEKNALIWLRSNEPEPSIVLSNSIKMGSYLPALAQQKTVLGHWSQTYDIHRKATEAYHFFATPAPDPFHQKLLDKYNVDYIYTGTDEKKPRGLKLDDLPYLTKVFDEPPVQLYRVNQ